MDYLFERLVDAAGERGAGADLKQRVKDQVQRLVCTCSRDGRDESLSAIDFGLPNIAEINRGNLSKLDRYAQRLKQLIEHYEPRLRNVAVELEKTEQVLSPYSIAVSGTLAGDGERHTFQFSADR